MNYLTLHTIRCNAFRILGLSGAATQAEIDGAARLLRLLPPGEEGPAMNNAPWLGPVPQGGPNIEQAVMRLTDPETRIFERLWWFSLSPPVSDRPSPLAVAPDPQMRARYQHDEAIAGLCRLLVVGVGQSWLHSWSDLMAQFQRVAANNDYLQWLLDIERAGEFEKSANFEEIAALLAGMADFVTTAVVAMADESLGEGHGVVASRIVGMLYETNGSQLNDACLRILERMEDVILGQCNQHVAQIDEAWKTKRVDRLKPACSRALRGCNENLTSTLDGFGRWLEEDPGRVLRVRGQVVAVYVHIADAYEACMDKYSARQTLMNALPLAGGLAVEPRLRQRVEALTSARPTPAMTNASAADSGGGGGGTRNYYTSGSRWPWIVLVIVVINVIRMCATMPGRHSSSSFEPDRDYTQLNQEINRVLATQPVSQGDDWLKNPNIQAAFERQFERSTPKPASRPAPGLH